MYSKKVPYKDFKDRPGNATVYFNLTEREVFKLLGELQAVFAWIDSIRDKEVREIPTEDVVAFYNNFEDILLTAWGEPSEDGMHFRKGGRYDFEESAIFNACMVLFITDPSETMKLIEGILPSGMDQLVKTADENAVQAGKEVGSETMQAEIDRLRAQIQQQGGHQSPQTPPAT